MQARRLLKRAKWTGLALCVLLAGVWVASGWWTWRWHRCIGASPAAYVLVGRGVIRLGIDHPFSRKAPTGRFGRVTQIPASNVLTHAKLMLLGPFRELGGVGWRWLPEMTRPRGFQTWSLSIPLWPAFAVSVVGTALVWRRDRGPRPGLCRCGYDLGGLRGRPCPECGAGAEG